MSLLTLTAEKIKGSTYLYLDSKLKCIIPQNIRQPRKDKRTIIINCFKYKLKFI